MSNVAFIVFFFVIYVSRFYYDIKYLYNECLETRFAAIITVSIIHSLVFAFMASAWVGSNKVFMYAMSLCIFILFGWIMFGDCFLTIIANKICKKNIKYLVSWWNIVIKILIILYALRIVIFILNFK